MRSWPITAVCMDSAASAPSSRRRRARCRHGDGPCVFPAGCSARTNRAVVAVEARLIVAFHTAIKSPPATGPSWRHGPVPSAHAAASLNHDERRPRRHLLVVKRDGLMIA
jgi:hypothetical protein